MKQLAGLILSLIHLNVCAQEFHRLVDEIPVSRFEQPLDYPFLGGLDAFDPRFADIDADGDLDLFILQPDGRIYFLENTAVPPDHYFHLVTDHFAGMNAHGWFYLADMAADSDPDMYTDKGNLGLAFYRNQGAATSHDFVLDTNEVTAASGLPVFGEPSSFPTFADIDADGDLDFFSCLSSGTIARYENSGTGSRPTFLLASTAWQDLLIVSGLNRGAPPLQNSHGANGIEFTDLDGDPDLFVGSFFGALAFLENTGYATSLVFSLVATAFQEIDVGDGGAPSLADLDDDGDIEARLAKSGGSDHEQHRCCISEHPNRTQAAPRHGTRRVSRPIGEPPAKHPMTRPSSFIPGKETVAGVGRGATTEGAQCPENNPQQDSP